MQVAAKRLVAGKWGPCCGQACVGIDYILVERRFASTLVGGQSRHFAFIVFNSFFNLRDAIDFFFH